MLNLDAEKKAQEPWWFTLHEAQGDVPAVRVRFAPIGRIALRAARRAASEHYLGADIPEGDDAPLPPELLERAGDAMSESLLRSGIIEWEGVGDAGGNPVAVSPEALDLFLADPLRFDRLDEAYIRPFILKELEKNDYAVYPNGTSGVAAETIAEACVTSGATAGVLPTPAVPPTPPSADVPTTPTSPAPTPV